MTNNQPARRPAAAQRPPARPPQAAPTHTRPAGPSALRAVVENPAAASPAGLRAIQRAYGNRAVNQALQRAPAPLPAAPAAPQPTTGLPADLKAGVEALSGVALDNVSVHYNSAKPAQVSALAYAQGTDIHVAPGQEQHLPHEAWHVVQQAQGRVQPTLQLKTGLSVNADQGLEHEADVMGQKAAALPPSAAPARPLNRLAPQVRPAIMRVAQMTFQEKIKALVYQPDAPAAGPLIDDLARAAEKSKDAFDEAAFGPDELMRVATGFGYDKGYAARLATKDPFEKDEIPKHTSPATPVSKTTTQVDTFHQTQANEDRHNLIFSNAYDTKGHAVMNSNYRNPLLTAFQAKDVVDHQLDVALGKPKAGMLSKGRKPLKSITRKGILS